MGYSDFLKPRPEVLSEDGIEGIIDLANLQDKKKKKLENNPELFFDLTYPTDDIRRVIQQLHERFTKPGRASGLFLSEGLKGIGKSHLLLLIYHLFSNPTAAQAWLQRHRLTCSLPTDTVVIVNKFTDLPLDSIWDFIFEQLTTKKPKKNIIQPGLPDVEKALAGRKMILILDELEQGIRVIGDATVRAQNIAFLQMLSEWSNRSNQITLFCSIYSDQEEPGSTLKRVPACRVQFSHTRDKARVVLHRLFQNYLEFDSHRVIGVVESYVNLWRRYIAFNADEYRNQMSGTYPFLPELLELILDRVPVRGGFQNVRGALGFLAHLVRRTSGKTDWITAAHASLKDREVATRLADLDAGGLISKARSNLDDLKAHPQSDEIGATTLLYTLTATGRLRGATKEELVKHVLTPESDINDLEKSLMALQKYASHFWCQEGQYYFDVEENPDAKVEFHSLRFSEDIAREWLARLWQDEVFRDPQSAVMINVEKTREFLETMDKNRLRYVLAPRRLNANERHDLYYGIQNRNLVILVEPKDATFDLFKHPDLLKWARRCRAAGELAGMTQDSERRTAYERIGREDKKHCSDAITKAGLLFVRWERYGENVQDDRIEEESLAGANKDQVLNTLGQQYFPQQVFEEHLLKDIKHLRDRTVREVDQEYKATPGFPVPVTVRSVTGAVRALCRKREIGLRHPRGNFCEEDPPLNDAELLDATIDAPFETTPTPGQLVRPPVGTRGTETKQPSPVSQGKEVLDSSVVTSLRGRREEITTRPQTSQGALRQEVAVRLHSYPEARITRVRLSLFLDQETGDLSALPVGLRGNLSGPGSLTAEIRIVKEGEFSKSEVEKMIEALPIIPKAEYSADMTIWISEAPQEAPGD